MDMNGKIYAVSFIHVIKICNNTYFPKKYAILIVLLVNPKFLSITYKEIMFTVNKNTHFFCLLAQLYQHHWEDLFEDVVTCSDWWSICKQIFKGAARSCLLWCVVHNCNSQLYFTNYKYKNFMRILWIVVSWVFHWSLCNNFMGISLWVHDFFMSRSTTTNMDVS